MTTFRELQESHQKIELEFFRNSIKEMDAAAQLIENQSKFFKDPLNDAPHQIDLIFSVAPNLAKRVSDHYSSNSDVFVMTHPAGIMDIEDQLICKLVQSIRLKVAATSTTTSDEFCGAVFLNLCELIDEQLNKGCKVGLYQMVLPCGVFTSLTGEKVFGFSTRLAYHFKG